MKFFYRIILKNIFDIIYGKISKFNEKYNNYSLDETRKISHSADGELTSPSGLRCLLEVKNYTSSVPIDELKKITVTRNYREAVFEELKKVKALKDKENKAKKDKMNKKQKQNILPVVVKIKNIKYIYKKHNKIIQIKNNKI